MEQVAQKISTHLKKLRQDKGWSLDKTSERTGVSKAMLGQIERGESSPTISTLWKIASGFETSFSSFLEEDLETENQLSVHKKGPPQQLHPQDSKIKITPIFAFDKSLNFEVFVIELLPGCQHLSSPHQKGVIEHILVCEGAVEILFNDLWHKVSLHEGLKFCADQPHGYRNLSNQTAVIHNLIHYP